MEFIKNDCCGIGCANCVLNFQLTIDRKTTLADLCKTGQTNVLNKFSDFCLLDKKPHLLGFSEIIELHYKSLSNKDDYILNLEPGEHVMMRISRANILNCNGTDQTQYVLRPYSPFWWNVTTMEFKILIKLQPKGLVSKYLNDLEQHSKVEFRVFPTTYQYQPDTDGICYKLIITQGVAVAASIPIIEQILNNEDDMTRIIHLACFTNVNHIYFRDKLKEFNKYWNYKGITYLSRQCCDNTLCIELGHCREQCSTFKNQLGYKDHVHPFRLDAVILKNICSTSLGKDANGNFAVLAGSGDFQNHYKILLREGDYNFLDKNIYVL